MVVRIDGVENKELGRDRLLLQKFLRENTHSGKVDADVEIFKSALFQRPKITDKGKASDSGNNEFIGL